MQFTQDISRGPFLLMAGMTDNYWHCVNSDGVHVALFLSEGDAKLFIEAVGKESERPLSCTCNETPCVCPF